MYANQKNQGSLSIKLFAVLLVFSMLAAGVGATGVTTLSSDGVVYNLASSSPVTITIHFDSNITVDPTVSVAPDGGAQTVGDCGDANDATFCFDYSIPAATESAETLTIDSASDGVTPMAADSSHAFGVDTIAPGLERGYAGFCSHERQHAGLHV